MIADKMRADFEEVAEKHAINIEPSPAILPSNPVCPYKYMHSNYLFAIFCDGWQAASAVQAAEIARLTAELAQAHAALAVEKEPVAWMVYAEFEGVMCPQHPPSSTPMRAERDCKAYGDDVTTKVRPLYTHPQPSADDALRLDFMITHGAWIAWSKDHEKFRVFHHDEGKSVPMMGWTYEEWHHKPIDAIDAAMKATQ